MTYAKIRPNGEITMISETKQEGFVKITLDKEKVEKGHKMKVVNGKVEYEKPKCVFDEEDKQEFISIKEEIEKSEMSDKLKQSFIKMIKKLYTQ